MSCYAEKHFIYKEISDLLEKLHGINLSTNAIRKRLKRAGMPSKRGPTIHGIEKVKLIVQANFLKELPSYNETNFTRFHADSGIGKTNMKRPAVYISTKDYPVQQVITTEKTNILLRYLHQQWDRKNSSKRDSTRASLESSEGTSPQKMPRLSQEDDNS